jgi:hypothetical protein
VTDKIPVKISYSFLQKIPPAKIQMRMMRAGLFASSSRITPESVFKKASGKSYPIHSVHHRVHTEWQRPLSGVHSHHDGKISPGW